MLEIIYILNVLCKGQEKFVSNENHVNLHHTISAVFMNDKLILPEVVAMFLKMSNMITYSQVPEAYIYFNQTRMESST